MYGFLVFYVDHGLGHTPYNGNYWEDLFEKSPKGKFQGRWDKEIGPGENGLEGPKDPSLGDGARKEENKPEEAGPSGDGVTENQVENPESLGNQESRIYKINN